MNEEINIEPQGIRFFHSVGQSTLRQGITIPIQSQVSWLRKIKKGEKVDVQLLFGPNLSVLADIRRLNNAAGHLQFRYETKKQALLREFLNDFFDASIEQNDEVLEIIEVKPRVFWFKPVSHGDSNPTLSLYKPYFHNIDETLALNNAEFHELKTSLNTICYNTGYNQRDYNKSIARSLLDRAWQSEVRVLKEIGLRCDFEKNGVWLEIEFGNARTYYQDYFKFLLALKYKQGLFGVLLCPTAAFAQLLCELGQKKAYAKNKSKARPPQYSGMMSYEKAIKELPYFEFFLQGQIVVAGIDICG